MSELNEWPYTQATIDTLGQLVKRPTLKAKLLSRPPFKYIYDIVMSCMQVCQFGAGEFQAEHIQSSDNIKDKNDKIDFLTTLITCISTITQQPVHCHPVKIIAGLECEATNIMLQQLYTACCILQQQAQHTTAQTNEADVKSVEPSVIDQSAVSSVLPVPVPVSGAMSGAADAISSVAQPVLQQSASVYDPAIDLHGMIADTQRLLSPLIDRPRLSEKLLQKPPFRFLHDIVTALHHTYQWPPTLYTAEELNSANYSDPQSKLIFLQKLIEYTAQCSATDLTPVNAKKIAAGLEPENTNRLLQAMAQAVQQHRANSINTPVAASTVNNTDLGTIHNDTDAPPSVDGMQTAPQQPVAQTSSNQPLRAVPLRSTGAAAVSADALPDSVPVGTVESAASVPDVAATCTSVADAPVSAYERPKTARRAPPRSKAQLAEPVPASKQQAATQSAANVLLDSGVEDVEELEDSNGEMQHDAVMDGQSTAADVFRMNEQDDNDGILVQRIKQLHAAQADGDTAPHTQPHSSVSVSGELATIESLRTDVQRMCGHINPIGKLMCNVVDDIQHISHQLTTYQSRIDAQHEQLQQEQRTTQSTVHSLRAALQRLEWSRCEKQKQIAQLQSQIYKRDTELHALFTQKTAIV